MLMKNNSMKLVLLTMGMLTAWIVLALFFSSCSKDEDPTVSFPRKVTIEYRVTATNGITKATSLGYTNSTGGNTTLSDATIPFSVEFDRIVNLGDDIGVSVLHNNSATGDFFTMKLEILVDNKLLKTATFEGNNSAIGAIVHVFN